MWINVNVNVGDFVHKCISMCACLRMWRGFMFIYCFKRVVVPGACVQLLVMNLAALVLICSNLSMFLRVCGSHTVEQYWQQMASCECWILKLWRVGHRDICGSEMFLIVSWRVYVWWMGLWDRANRKILRLWGRKCICQVRFHCWRAAGVQVLLKKSTVVRDLYCSAQ